MKKFEHMAKRVSGTTALVFAVLASTASVGSENSAPESGREAYERECAICHEGFGTGSIMLGRRLGKDRAQLSSRTDLVPDYVRHVVRHGLNSMPALSRVEVTEQQLEGIIAYLTAPRAE